MVDGFHAWKNFHDEASSGSLLVLFFREVPSTGVTLLDFDIVGLKCDVSKECSVAPKDKGPLFDVSRGTPAAPS